MPAVLLDSQGRVLTNGTGPYVVDDVFTPPTYTGTVDVEGLTALGWDTDDIDWLQKHVWWDKEDNDYWKVTEANLAFGPNGSTPLTWANRSTIKANPDVRYFPKFNPSPSSATSWGSLFHSYMYLCAIPTHGWDTTKVTSLNSVFAYCYNLRSIGDLTNWNTSSLASTALAYTFYNCYNLLNIGDLSGWTTNNVTSMTGTFYCCFKLSHIGNLSNWNTAKVTTMASMFYYCMRIKDIGNLSNWDVSKVTSFGSMFCNCSNLDHLVGLNNWNVSAVTNFASMFYNCYNLKSVGDLSNWNTSSATSMGVMFSSCYNLAHIGELSNWNTSKVTNMYYMFGNCWKLKSIGDLSNWDVSKVNGTSSGSGFVAMFQYCYSLKNIGDLSNWAITMSGTKNQINAMFYNCVNLSSLKLNNWDVSKVINFANTLSGLRGLEELDVSGWDLSANTNSGTSADNSIFAVNYGLKKLKLGPKFFASTDVSTYYFSHLQAWTRDSIVESLYTNQTLRNSSSPAITIQIYSGAYDRLTADDKTNIASKNITLTRT